MMNKLSLFLLLFLAQQNIWSMEAEDEQVARARQILASTSRPKSPKIVLSPEAKAKIRAAIKEAPAAQTTQEQRTTNLLAEMQAQTFGNRMKLSPDLKDSLRVLATTQPTTQQTVPLPIVSAQTSDTPAQEQPSLVKKKKKKKKKTKSSQEEKLSQEKIDPFDALLAEFSQKDAQRRPRSPLRTSPKNVSGSTTSVILDPIDDELAIICLEKVNTSYGKSLQKCKKRHTIMKSHLIKYPSRDRDLYVKTLPSGTFSFHDTAEEWAFVAQKTRNGWQLNLGSNYKDRADIIDLLNTPDKDSRTPEASSDDEQEEQETEAQTSDLGEQPEESSSDDDKSAWARGILEELKSLGSDAEDVWAKKILTKLRESGQDSVVIDAEEKVIVEWGDPTNKKLARYSKDDETICLIDADTETIIF
jgi:hypothetical protein